MSNEYWSNLSLNTPYKYGDRITVGAPERKGTVTGFIGKKRETIIVQFEDNPGQSVTKKMMDTGMRITSCHSESFYQGQHMVFT